MRESVVPLCASSHTSIPCTTPAKPTCRFSLECFGEIPPPQSLPLPPERGLPRRCCALSCLSPYGPAERHLNLLAGLAHRHVKPQVFARLILHLKFPQ